LEFGQSVLGLAPSEDGERLAVVGRAATITVWDWRRGQLLHTLEGQAGYALPMLEGQAWQGEYFQKVAFSKSGRRLVSGGADGSLKLWDLTTGQELLTLKGCERSVVGVAFDGLDETLIAVGNGVFSGQVRIWDARPGKG
jgi:WD40 repeat protein